MSHGAVSRSLNTAKHGVACLCIDMRCKNLTVLCWGHGRKWPCKLGMLQLRRKDRTQHDGRA